MKRFLIKHWKFILGVFIPSVTSIIIALIGAFTGHSLIQITNINNNQINSCLETKPVKNREFYYQGEPETDYHEVEEFPRR